MAVELAKILKFVHLVYKKGYLKLMLYNVDSVMYVHMFIKEVSQLVATIKMLW